MIGKAKKRERMDYMKKLRQITLSLMIILAGLWIFIPSVKAEDPGYVYDELNVFVQVNEKREYQVREVMYINFEKKMHGIVRDIPKSSSVEKVEVKDIQVEGMPFTIDNRQDRVDVKIGDENELVSGERKITLTYTLSHYQDYDHAYDYIYINVLGTDYDTMINKFHAEITFPSPEALVDYRVTSGKQATTSNHYVKESIESNTLTMDSKDAIPAKTGVSAQLKFQEGVFSQAPEYAYPYVIKNNDLQIEITEQQDFLVTQTISYQADRNTRMCIPTISQAWEEGDFVIQDIQEPSDHKVKVYDDEIYVYAAAQEGTLTISYKVHPYRIMKDTILFTLNQKEEDTKIEQFTMQITAPQIITGKIELARDGDLTNDERYTLVTSNTSTSLISEGAIEAAENFTFRFPSDASVYHREQGSFVKFSLVISATLVLLCLLLRFVIFKKNKLIIPINFYPPKGMNSAEAGYIIDMVLSDNDLTSLIFYWADQGYLNIHHIQDDYYFEKVREVDASAPAYEQKLFNDMFAHGKDNIVKKDDLRFTFYQDIKVARDHIQKLYRGEHKLQKDSAEVMRKILMVLSALPFLYYLAASTLYTYEGGKSKIILCVLFVPFVMMAASLIVKSLKPLPPGFAGKATKFVYRAMACILLIALMIASRIEFTSVFWISLASSILVLVLANGIHKDSAYREEALIPLLGFKDFILQAEKDRLETLLTDDPEYYYHVLPYAQVLHVSDIWIHKFADILVVPPTWYMGNASFHYHDFEACVRTIERDMQIVAMPKGASNSSYDSSNNNDHYSGGGSGFSSGGSTGGGSGGGGSHGW